MTFRKKYSGKNKPDTHGQIINSYSFYSGLSNDKHWCLDLKKMHPGWKANKKNIEDKLTMRKANACFFLKNVYILNHVNSWDLRFSWGFFNSVRRSMPMCSIAYLIKNANALPPRASFLFIHSSSRKQTS